MKHNPNEVKEIIDDIKRVNPKEDLTRLNDTLTMGCDMRDKLFDVAGIDPAIVNEIAAKVESEDFTAEDISALIAPAIRKILSVEYDTEDSNPNEVKFKKGEGPNLLDEAGISDKEVSHLLALFSKCYNEDKESDWRELNKDLIGCLDKILTIAPESHES